MTDLDADALLRFDAVHKTFGSGDSAVHAVRGVQFSLHAGRALGLVGESGCGKSTTARLSVGLESPSEGEVQFEGQAIRSDDRAAMLERGGKVQYIFQDPYSSLNPRMSIGDIVAEPLVIQGMAKKERSERVSSSLTDVGLDSSVVHKYPHQFSGGQRQRIAIARALTVRPRLLVLDEPTSGLDVSIQGQILDLLADIRKSYNVAFLFISHDLAVIRAVCDEVAIMYLGEVVEHGSTETLFRRPLHPYSQALLAASLEPDPSYERGRKRVLAGSELPSPYAPPPGCTFHPRCHLASSLGDDGGYVPVQCASDPPKLRPLQDVTVACHFAEQTSQMLPTSRPGGPPS